MKIIICSGFLALNLFVAGQACADTPPAANYAQPGERVDFHQALGMDGAVTGGNAPAVPVPVRNDLPPVDFSGGAMPPQPAATSALPPPEEINLDDPAERERTMRGDSASEPGALSRGLGLLGLLPAAMLGLFLRSAIINWVPPSASPHDQARKWLGWTVLTVCGISATRFFSRPSINTFADFVFGLIAFGFIAYVLGYFYGKFELRQKTEPATKNNGE